MIIGVLADFAFSLIYSRLYFTNSSPTFTSPGVTSLSNPCPSNFTVSIPKCTIISNPHSRSKLTAWLVSKISISASAIA